MWRLMIWIWSSLVWLWRNLCFCSVFGVTRGLSVVRCDKWYEQRLHLKVVRPVIGVDRYRVVCS